MLLCNNSEMNNENEEELVVAKMNNDNEEQNNQVMLPVIDTSTRPSSSAVNNQIYATNSVIEELQEKVKGQEDIIQGIRKRLEELEVRDKKREMALETANLLLDKELERVSNFVEEKVLSLTQQVNANSKSLKSLSERHENVEKATESKLAHCDTELLCIKKDLSHFNQINKDFLNVVKTSMAGFDETINGTKTTLDNTLKEFRNERKNSDWALKLEVGEKMDKFEGSVEATNSRLSELTSMYDDIQDRIWEIEKSWRNNLMFHGIRYDDPSVEEDPNRTEEKIRTVIRVDLQLSRDIPILRAHRIRNGPLVKGTHPILVSFQNYNDREEVLRRSKLIRGYSGGGVSCGVKAIGTQSEPRLYITEDSSRRVREQRSELIKFSREVHQRFPSKHCQIKYQYRCLSASAQDLTSLKDNNYSSTISTNPPPAIKTVRFLQQ